MASYKGHLMFSSLLGGAYGSLGVLHEHLGWGPAFLGGGVTAVGGLLPDLDSDSGVPVRELFGLSAAIAPLVLYDRFIQDFNTEQTLVLLGTMYLLIRYGLSGLFKRFTVHRGMFHSVPAMLIAGAATYLAYHNVNDRVRWYIAIGVMLGFLSHLVLDELYSVDFMGARIKLNKFAGSAVKFWSPSWQATLVCYALLGALGWSVWKQYAPPM